MLETVDHLMSKWHKEDNICQYKIDNFLIDLDLTINTIRVKTIKLNSMT